MVTRVNPRVCITKTVLHDQSKKRADVRYGNALGITSFQTMSERRNNIAADVAKESANRLNNEQLSKTTLEMLAGAEGSEDHYKTLKFRMSKIIICQLLKL
jgi:hypothetical protein